MGGEFRRDLGRVRLARASLLGVSLLLAAAAAASPAGVARLEKQGVYPAIARRAGRHVALGLPSNATRANEKDFLLVRKGYVISYNADHNAMNWASWTVEKGDLGAIGRREAFRPDPTMPAHFYKPNSGDYKIPGYSRGHMVRSGERTASERENEKTYVFSNMLPQAVNNNAGPWNAFENYYRDEVQQKGLVAHVIAGGIFGAEPAPSRGVKIPTSTWKIVALLKPGQTADQIDHTTRVMAVVMPNNNHDVKVEHNWDRYRVSVADIEKRTGLTFFDHASPRVAAALKAGIDKETIPAPKRRDFVLRNYGETSGSRPAKLLASNLTGTVKWYSSDKKYGFITMADGKELFVHASERRTSIKEGEQVTFNLAEDRSGVRFASQVVSHSPNATPEVAGPVPVPQAVSRPANDRRPAAANDNRPAPQAPRPAATIKRVLARGLQGVVVDFDGQKGFGFVRLADGREAFVHRNDKRGFLERGTKVTLDLADTDRGLRATAVVALGGDVPRSAR
jgi:endonuclease G, mitochondrial